MGDSAGPNCVDEHGGEARELPVGGAVGDDRDLLAQSRSERVAKICATAMMAAPPAMARWLAACRSGKAGAGSLATPRAVAQAARLGAAVSSSSRWAVVGCGGGQAGPKASSRATPVEAKMRAGEKA